MINLAVSLGLFFLAALFKIGGGYLVWLWLRENKGALFGLLGGLILAVYGIIPTFQPAHFGRVYAAYGGIFIVSSLIWGAFVDKKNPDKYGVVGALIALIGVLIMFYIPR
jgi:small multidrug resistance family-3 protein